VRDHARTQLALGGGGVLAHGQACLEHDHLALGVDLRQVAALGTEQGQRPIDQQALLRVGAGLLHVSRSAQEAQRSLRASAQGLAGFVRGAGRGVGAGFGQLRSQLLQRGQRLQQAAVGGIQPDLQLVQGSRRVLERGPGLDPALGALAGQRAERRSA